MHAAIVIVWYSGQVLVDCKKLCALLSRMERGKEKKNVKTANQSR